MGQGLFEQSNVLKRVTKRPLKPVKRQTTAVYSERVPCSEKTEQLRKVHTFQQ